jgi:hypothetical protein
LSSSFSFPTRKREDITTFADNFTAVLAQKTSADAAYIPQNSLNVMLMGVAPSVVSQP